MGRPGEAVDVEGLAQPADDQKDRTCEFDGEAWDAAAAAESPGALSALKTRWTATTISTAFA
jgi:hypothetical protein